MAARVQPGGLSQCAGSNPQQFRVQPIPEQTATAAFTEATSGTCRGLVPGQTLLGIADLDRGPLYSSIGSIVAMELAALMAMAINDFAQFSCHGITDCAT